MEKSKLIVSYDKDADVAYLSFGEPKPSVTEELDDYVLVRRDPKTREVRGVTIINFSNYFKVKKEIKVEIPEP
ncbi:MAG: DUF2283 domain-containing protein [Thaumarchaeota archaeon]|nr:DUF2283 domain-containing protein [Nitrososphaerota archaeon]